MLPRYITPFNPCPTSVPQIPSDCPVTNFYSPLSNAEYRSHIHNSTHNSHSLSLSVTVRHLPTCSFPAVQYSTVQYSTVQCSTVPYITVQYSTVPVIVVRFNETLNFSRLCTVGAELLHGERKTDRQRDRQTERQTDMAKRMVAFRNLQRRRKSPEIFCTVHVAYIYSIQSRNTQYT